MITTWHNASVKEITEELRRYPGYKNYNFYDIVDNREDVWLRNPTAISGSKEDYKRLYEIATLPNSIFSGDTYTRIFFMLERSSVTKEYLQKIYDRLQDKTKKPIWKVEPFDGPFIEAREYGPFTVIFFNEKNKDY